MARPLPFASWHHRWATIAHVANDWLAVPLAVWMLALTIGYHERPGLRRIALAAFLLSPGLLTKAYILAGLDRVLAGVAVEVIFVDDDSPDGTAHLIRPLSLHRPEVRVLHRIGRRGLASAHVEGMFATAALYIAVMDAHLQHEESILPEILHIVKADPKSRSRRRQPHEIPFGGQQPRPEAEPRDLPLPAHRPDERFLIAVLATIAAMTSNFALNNIITYRDLRLKGAALFRGLLTFYAACSVGAVVSVRVSELVQLGGVHWLFAGAVVSLSPRSGTTR